VKVRWREVEGGRLSIEWEKKKEGCWVLRILRVLRVLRVLRAIRAIKVIKIVRVIRVIVDRGKDER